MRAKRQDQQTDSGKQQRNLQGSRRLGATGKKDAVGEPRPVNPRNEKPQAKVAQTRLPKELIQRLYPRKHGWPPPFIRNPIVPTRAKIATHVKEGMAMTCQNAKIPE